jgi:uncharacterized damage-inducible protein DinB
MSVLPFYAGYRRYNDLLAEAVAVMSDDELALRAVRAGAGADDGSPPDESSVHWPIWAIVAHAAGARVHWMCVFLGEPGIETATFADPESGEGWEDDLTKPRTAAEVSAALRTSWDIVEASLRRWTPEMLGEGFPTPTGLHLTRQSIVTRLITHDGYHAGEIALIQGMHGRPQLDLWPPGAHTVERSG